MGNINLLGTDLANKIAAGEVVERPASAVKELLENSLDAGATDIKVEVREGGKSLIRISDNGSGMSPDDAVLCIERHATSKIKEADDLFRIRTLGFRGEALASIAAVSVMKLITKTRATVQGVALDIEAGHIAAQKDIGCPVGTAIEINELFYNTPARKKYLGSIQTEFAHISDIVTRYALSNPLISFQLIHNGKAVLSSPKAKDMLSNIANIYGADIALNLIPVEHRSDFVSISGYISKPALVRASRDQQSFYVNSRYIKNPVITDALYDAYHTLLMQHKHPIAVLCLTMDPTKIDVNVHPKKDIIRIEREKELYDCVFDSVRQALLKEDLIQEVSADTCQNMALPKPQHSYKVTSDRQSMLVAKESLDSHLPNQRQSESAPLCGGERDLDKSSGARKDAGAEGGLAPPKDSSFENTSSCLSERQIGVLAAKRLSTKPGIGPVYIIGQLNKTYILAEDARGLLIIDQHAAQERVNYERYMQQLAGNRVELQRLMRPHIIELTICAAQSVKSSLDMLNKIGFETEEYGDSSFLVRTIPSVMGSVGKSIIADIMEEIAAVGKTDMDGSREERIIRFACRKSVKAGEELTPALMQDLIEELDLTEQPFTCPHGRPTVISMPLCELERKFKRVV